MKNNLLKQHIPSAFLVGTPASESPSNILGNVKYVVLPNNKSEFCVSTMHWDYWYGYEGDALMPDITVYQTYEDLINGVDTVWEAILNMEISQ